MSAGNVASSFTAACGGDARDGIRGWVSDINVVPPPDHGALQGLMDSLILHGYAAIRAKRLLANRLWLSDPAKLDVAGQSYAPGSDV